LERRERLSEPTGVKKPLFLKIAPDLAIDDENDIADIVIEQGIDALIMTNTTIDRPADLAGQAKSEKGGLSGRPLFDPSTRQIGRFFDRLGKRIPLVGVGGIDNAERAFAKIRAGASALQLYTGFIYGGPKLIRHILSDLDQLLARDGFASVSDAVGIDRPKNID
jgi:dihydroorotate dehydrogenase